MSTILKSAPSDAPADLSAGGLIAPDAFPMAAAGAVSRTGRADGDQWAVLAGIRFALAAIVLCHHISDHSPLRMLSLFGNGGAFAAVLSFFVISGYSMAHSLGREPGGAMRFYERRFWRIYPNYLFALALATLPMILFATVFPHAPMGFADAPSRAQFLQAAFFLQGFTMPGDLPGNGVVWSLSVEVWLYALSPLLMKVSGRAFAALFAASSLLDLAHDWITHTNYNSDSYGIALVSLAWTFLLGFALYRFRPLFTAERMIAVLIAALAIGAANLNSGECYGPAVFAATLAAVYFCPRLTLPKPSVKLLLWLGDLSFCLYLVHVPILNIAYGFDYHNPYLIASACLAFAAITLYCIDYPVRAYRRQSLRLQANPAR